MKTRYLLYLVILAVLSLVLGIAMRSWVFLSLSIFNIALLSISVYSLPPEEMDIEIERQWKEKDVYEGGDVWVNIGIKNFGEKISFLEIHDDVPSRVEITEGTNHQILELDSGETKQFRYKVSTPLRGKQKIGPIKIRYRDPLSLYSQEMTIDDEITISVLPEIEDISQSHIRPKNTRYWLGNIRSGRVGIGSEFYSLREYHAGDEMRKINWKASARYLEPISNQYEAEMSGDVIIIVDGFKASNVGRVRKNILGASTRAAASVASSVLEDRNRVGLIVIGDFLYWVYPGFGRDQFYKIMDNLSHLEGGGLWELQDTMKIIKRFFKRKSLIVFISPLLEPKVTETLIDLCRKGYEVVVISPSPLELEKELEGIDNTISEKIHHLERRNIIDELWKYAMVVDWNPNEPLESAITEVERFYQK